MEDAAADGSSGAVWKEKRKLRAQRTPFCRFAVPWTDKEINVKVWK